MKKFNMPHLALQIFESVQLMTSKQRPINGGATPWRRIDVDMTLFEGVPAGMISSQGEYSDIFINT